MMRAVRLVLAVCAAIVAVVAFVPAASAADVSGGVYVALGDSFASGEGSPGFDAGTDDRANTCHRSETAWARQLGVPRDYLLACSGALIEDVIGVGTAGTPRLGANGRPNQGRPDDVTQLSRLTAIRDSLAAAGSHIALVTVTLGGNNLGFSDIIRDCRRPRGNCLSDYDTKVVRKMDEVGKALTGAYRQIAAVVPGAKVVVVGYPDIVPRAGIDWYKCNWAKANERRRVQRLEGALDGILRNAAARAGVAFISIRGALAGHELCTHDSWVHPITALFDGNPLTNKRQGHPTPPGQTAMAAAVRSQIAVPAAAAAASPADGTPHSLVGTWEGPLVSNTGLAYRALLRIREIAPGVLAGQTFYTGRLTCSGGLTFVGAAGGGGFRLNETITSDTGASPCASTDPQILTRTSATTMHFYADCCARDEGDLTLIGP
jgi:hypothetical protein